MSVRTTGDAAPMRGVSGRPPALALSGISKTFGARTVLHPFDLSVAPGEVHMLLGQNGSGKSTLIKILAGFHQPDTGGTFRVAGTAVAVGSADAARSAGLRFVHQDLGLVLSESVLDNMLYGHGYGTRFGTIRARAMRARVLEAARRVGLEDVDPAVAVATLSPAQRTGVALARALMPGGEPVSALVLDEPTATLPVEEVSRLHQMLRVATANGVGVLYVTHHLDEVDQLGDQVSVLRDGRLVESSPVDGIDRATLVHRLIGAELEEVQRETATSAAPVVTGQRPALEVRGLRGDRLHGIDLIASAGEILGIYGITGSGRESLLGAVFGAVPRSAGTVRVGDTEISAHHPAAAIRAGIAYLPPDRKTSGGFLNLSAAENMTLTDLGPFWKRGRLNPKAERKHAQEWFDRLGVRPADGTGNDLSTFSGGNQQKVVMAKWLRLEPAVLLLDEPTQGVDVGAKAELHRQILECRGRGAAVVVSSTDIDELTALCDRVLILKQGDITRELRGTDVNERNINSGFLEESPVEDE